jgi:hypothetical protein
MKRVGWLLLLLLPVFALLGKPAGAVSSNADLAGISTPYPFTTEFSPNVTEYHAYAPSGTTTYYFAARFSDATATMQYRINGLLSWLGLPDWTSSGEFGISTGINTIEIKVTAQDRTTKTYTVYIHVPQSNDASLRGLTLSTGALSPAFTPGVYYYTQNVPNEVTSVNVTPVLTDSKATLTLNGAALTNGTASTVNLPVGPTTATIVATSANAAVTHTYQIIINRAGSSNNDLSSLTLSSGTLSPAFTSTTTSYTASVPFSAGSLQVTPVKTHPDASVAVAVNGSPYTSPMSYFTLNLGMNTVNVKVTAQDGTPKIYTIMVLRKNNNANLSSLSLSSGELSPGFSSGISSYTTTVANESITVTPTKADLNANVRVRVNGGEYQAASSPLPLEVGANTVEIQVTAEDGTIKIYSIEVERLSGIADLSTLSLSAGELNPLFDRDTIAYSAIVPNETDTLTVYAPAYDEMAVTEIRMNGGVYAPVDTPLLLQVGTNTLEVKVTAPNGNTKVYTVAVTRTSNDASLSGLSIPGVELSPGFNSSTISYVGTVGSDIDRISLELSAAHPQATLEVQINGGGYTGGLSPIPLQVGSNTVRIKVKAQDGTERIYTIHILRQSSNAALSTLGLSVPTVSPSFQRDIYSYQATVSSVVYSVYAWPQPEDPHAYAMVRVNQGTYLPPGTELPLQNGNNLVEIKVQAQDGTERLYTVQLTKLRGEGYLSGLSLSTGTLSPAFHPEIYQYSSAVNSSVEQLRVHAYGTAPGAMVTVRVGHGEWMPLESELPLADGSNLVEVRLQPEDPAVPARTYSILVTRQQLSGVALSSAHTDAAGYYTYLTFDQPIAHQASYGGGITLAVNGRQVTVSGATYTDPTTIKLWVSGLIYKWDKVTISLEQGAFRGTNGAGSYAVTAYPVMNESGVVRPVSEVKHSLEELRNASGSAVISMKEIMQWMGQGKTANIDVDGDGVFTRSDATLLLEFVESVYVK